MKGRARAPLVLILGAVLVVAAAVGLLLFRGEGRTAFDGNVLIITLDTTRADSLGVYGGEGDHTPHLDRLAREGVMFRNCLTPVPLTLPAHCSLFTGRNPLAHQVRNNGRYALAEAELTLAERFKAAGWRSYAVIASYVLLGRFGLKQGFDEYDDSLDSYKIMNSYNTEITADAVSGRFRGWLSNHREERFFAWVHFYDPHEPYAPPLAYRTDPKETDPKTLYLGEVEFMDHHLGLILQELESLGLRDKTLVVAVGDHGEAFEEHGEKGHAIFCYEENVRVPLIFFHETLLPRNAVVEDRVGLIDVLPTILELTGLEQGKGIQGRSLVPCFQTGAKPPPPPPIYLESFFGLEEMGWAPVTGIVDGDWKYLSLPRPELYDLRGDPSEKQNLHGTRPDLASRLKKELADLVASHTEIQSETRRELSGEELRQLQSLGYIAASSRRAPTNTDPKDGILLTTKMTEFFKTLETVPLREIDSEIEKILRENGIEKSPAFYSRLWRLYEKRGERQKAIRTLEEAASEFPDDVGILMQLTHVYSVVKRYDSVLSLGRRILDQDPANSIAHILMADVYAATEDWPRAQVSLEKAIEIEPENVSLLIKYAETLIARQKIPDALEMYDLLLTKNDVLSDDEFLYKLALFYSKNGRDRRAADLLERCGRLSPSGKYAFTLAVVQARLENYEAAREAMRTALERYADELTPEQRAQAEKFLRSFLPTGGR